MASHSKRLDVLEPMAMARSGMLEHSVYGVVDRVDKIDGKLVPNIIRRWKGTIGSMKATDEDATILLIEKLEPLILIHKKHKGCWGGRGGTKSRFAQDVMVGEVNSQGTKVFVLRERMKALKQSIYAGIEKAIKDLSFAGFRSIPSHWEIRHGNGGKFVFGGMQNIIDMKGASTFKIFLTEEAAKTKQNTIDVLGPTLRDMPGAELWWLWNPESSQDPMSKEYITPYQAHYDRQGYFEDDHHLFIQVGYKDNPWFVWDESLQQELEKDEGKVKAGIMSKTRFNHIWLGMFNDDIETSVIQSEWFEACIDAHIHLGFEALGAITSACDPSDVGNDPCGYAQRKGVVFQEVTEIEAVDGNRKMDLACQMAIMAGADSFGYDADGLGATLRDNVSSAFKGKKTHIFAYKGSTKIHDPKAQFKSETAHLTNRSESLKNEDVLKNKKAQNIIGIAERIYKTFMAVVHNKYCDPDELISFASFNKDTGIGIKQQMLDKLKAEACKTPLKPGDTIRFYTKEELRTGIKMPDGNRVTIPSPNLFDAVVVSLDKDCIVPKIKKQTNTQFVSLW